MTNRLLVYTPKELLASGDFEEPLIAAGVRCHGGFDSDGSYRSPRILHRAPAILAWKEQLQEEGGELIDIPRAFVPPQYPNVAQAKVLLHNGVRDPMVRALTIISIVEGFGAMIRDVRVPDLEADVVESVEGTTLAHLANGLFEAHARDESGYREEGGHKQMWEAARDAALENPKIPGDVLMRLMGRRGQRGKAEPMFPQLGPKWERMIGMMSQVLVIEVFAESTFQWGIDVLSDPAVSADPETAGRMVDYIRADENPHVEYLRTALSELRTRTIRTVDGNALSGAEVVDKMLHRILRQLTANRREEQRDDLREGLVEAMKVAPNPEAVLEEFDSLESEWTPPAKTGFEPAAAA
jgi:hypothetical protein